MRIDSLYQFIVPLAFLAIWALTSLFNRETQPLPPRTGRPPGPNGPRPAASTSTLRPGEWRPEFSPRESPASRPPGAGPGGLQGRPGDRQDEEILIIDSEPRRPGNATPLRAGTGTTSPRRGSRARSTAQQSPRRAEPPTPRVLANPLTRPEAPTSISPQGLNPLVLPPSPLLSTPNDEAAKAQAGRALVTERDSFSSADIRRGVQTPARLREAFIVNELLQPPIALRGSSPLRPRR